MKAQVIRLLPPAASVVSVVVPVPMKWKLFKRLARKVIRNTGTTCSLRSVDWRELSPSPSSTNWSTKSGILS